jgi:predicted regulator of Ras-like GTPase activity (Roadblock/LC7/MglB family)
VCSSDLNRSKAGLREVSFESPVGKSFWVFKSPFRGIKAQNYLKATAQTRSLRTMLQRVLAGLCRLEGVNQAMLIDDSGQLLASVGEEGVMPPFEQAVEMIQVAQETGDALGLGQVYEVWCESKKRMIIDVAAPNRIVVLSGDGGRLARWRHALDRDRRILATTPRM